MKHLLPLSLASFLIVSPVAPAIAQDVPHEMTAAPTLSPEQQADQVLELFDTDRDGRLNKDEYAHGTVKAFEAMDKDADIKLESTELDRPQDEEIKKADTDGNAQLSFTEILKHQEKAFNDKDNDGDGYLSKDEIAGSIREKVKAQ